MFKPNVPNQPFDICNAALSLKYHFTKKKHDYFATPYVVNREAFAKRKDQHVYAKLANHYDWFNWLLANIVVNPAVWTGSLASKEAEQTYLYWAKTIQALSHSFALDLSKLLPDFDENVTSVDSKLPPIVHSFVKGKISLETLMIIIDLCNGHGYMDKHLGNDPVWKNLSFRIRKYKPFLVYEKKHFLKILVRHFEKVV
jgi:hypothetical protein